MNKLDFVVSGYALEQLVVKQQQVVSVILPISRVVIVMNGVDPLQFRQPA